VLTVVLVCLSADVSFGQQPQQTKTLQFEVAAIRPGNPKLGAYSSSSSGAPGGQFRMINMPLKQWVEMALSVRDYALQAPSWLDTSRFDLDARLPAEMPADKNAIPEMMKSLLIERFKLRCHEQPQNVSGYELVADKKVLVKPSGPLEKLRGHWTSSGPAFIGGTNISMSELATALGAVLERPVVDATHLSGAFDVKLIWSPSDAAAVAEEKRYGKKYGIDVDNLPSSVFTALREQLGLRLQSTKIPANVFVGDYISKQPTEN
jgi:uncharacterized protein (TIGR03435 family)